MARMRLTQAAVEKVRPPAVGRIELFDSHLPGFGLRVSEGGHKSWVLFYRVGGRQRRFTLGTLAQMPEVAAARARARELLAEVGRGIDPADAKEPPAPSLSVSALVAEFFDRYARSHNRSWPGTLRLFEIHVLPRWGNRPAASITYHDVLNLLDEVAKTARIGQNRVLASVRKLFAWAVERRLLPSSPAMGVKAPAKETTRERVLSDAELAAVWRAAGALGGPAGAFVRTLILTATRRDEAATMRWDDVDLDRALWTLPREMTKADRTHEVPLSPLAIEALTSVPREGDYVFSTTCGRRPVSAYSKIKAKLDALSPEMPHWTFHDLRRTAGTGLARLGVPVSTISRVLNHAEGGTTRIYVVTRISTKNVARWKSGRATSRGWSGHLITWWRCGARRNKGLA